MINYKTKTAFQILIILPVWTIFLAIPFCLVGLFYCAIITIGFILQINFRLSEFLLQSIKDYFNQDFFGDKWDFKNHDERKLPLEKELDIGTFDNFDKIDTLYPEPNFLQKFKERVCEK